MHSLMSHSRTHNPIKQWSGAECVSTFRCFTWKSTWWQVYSRSTGQHASSRSCTRGHRLEATYDSSPRHCCLSNHHHRHTSTGSGCIVRSCTETAQFHTPTPYEFLYCQKEASWQYIFWHIYWMQCEYLIYVDNRVTFYKFTGICRKVQELHQDQTQLRDCLHGSFFVTQRSGYFCICEKRLLQYIISPQNKVLNRQNCLYYCK